MKKAKKVIKERLSKVSDWSVFLTQLEHDESWKNTLQIFESKGLLSKINSESMVKNILLHHAYLNTSFQTIFGSIRLKHACYEFKTDPLKAIEISVYDSVFLQKNGVYYPLTKVVYVKQGSAEWIRGYYEKKMLEKWRNISDSLAVVHPVTREMQKPVLKFKNGEPDKHLYFCYSKTKNIVKVGVTENLERRLSEIRRAFHVDDAKFIAIDWFAGNDAEKYMHNLLNQHLYKEEGYGREWFVYNESVKELIESYFDNGVKESVTDEQIFQSIENYEYDFDRNLW